jgi:hypothetical protein
MSEVVNTIPDLTIGDQVNLNMRAIGIADGSYFLKQYGYDPHTVSKINGPDRFELTTARGELIRERPMTTPREQGKPQQFKLEQLKRASC